MSQFRTQLLEQEKAIGEKNLEVYKLKEDVMKAKKEAEKAAARMKSLGSGSGSATEKEIELQNEVDKCMVRCLHCIMRAKNDGDVFVASPQMFDMSECYAQHRDHEMHALCVDSSVGLLVQMFFD